jgi:hypothetical protein
MAYVAKVPWQGLGMRVEHDIHARAMIGAAGLD